MNGRFYYKYYSGFHGVPWFSVACCSLNNYASGSANQYLLERIDMATKNLASKYSILSCARKRPFEKWRTLPPNFSRRLIERERFECTLQNAEGNQGIPWKPLYFSKNFISGRKHASESIFGNDAAQLAPEHLRHSRKVPKKSPEQQVIFFWNEYLCDVQHTCMKR